MEAFAQADDSQAVPLQEPACKSNSLAFTSKRVNAHKHRGNPSVIAPNRTLQVRVE